MESSDLPKQEAQEDAGWNGVSLEKHEFNVESDCPLLLLLAEDATMAVVSTIAVVSESPSAATAVVISTTESDSKILDSAITSDARPIVGMERKGKIENDAAAEHMHGTTAFSASQLNLPDSVPGEKIWKPLGLPSVKGSAVTSCGRALDLELSQSGDSTPTVQKLKIKIPRSLSIPAAPTSAKAELSGLALLSTAAAFLSENMLLELSAFIPERDDPTENGRLTIVTEEPPIAPTKPAIKVRPGKKKRPRTGSDSDEEEMLREGTEINGFIYFPAKTPQGPNLIPVNDAPIASLTTSGRPTRQAALNNKLIRGGFVSESGTDNDVLYRRPKLNLLKKKIELSDDPVSKLAKVKASLSSAATDSFPRALEKTQKNATIPPKPVKITATAKQRLSRKLGLK